MDERNNNVNIGVGYYSIHDPDNVKLYLNALLESQKRWDLAKDYELKMEETIGELPIDPKSKIHVDNYLNSVKDSIYNEVYNKYNGDFGAALDFIKDRVIESRKIIPLAQEAYKRYETNRQLYSNLKAQGKLSGSYYLSDQGTVEFKPYEYDEIFSEPYLNYEDNTLSFNEYAERIPKSKWDDEAFIQNVSIPLLNKTSSSNSYSVSNPVKNLPEAAFLTRNDSSVKGMTSEEFKNFIKTKKGQEYLENLVDVMFSDENARIEFNNDKDLAKKFLVQQIPHKLYKINDNKTYIENNMNLNSGSDELSIDFNDNDVVYEPTVFSDTKMIKTFNNADSILTEGNKFNIVKEASIRGGQNPNVPVSVDYVTFPKEEVKISPEKSSYFDLFKGVYTQFGILKENNDGTYFVNQEKFKTFSNFIKNKIQNLSVPNFVLVGENFNSVSTYITRMNGIDQINSIKFNYTDERPNVLVDHVFNKNKVTEKVNLTNPGIAKYYNFGHQLQKQNIYKEIKPNTTFINNPDITIKGKPVKSITLMGYDPETLDSQLLVKFENGEEVATNTNILLKSISNEISNLISGVVSKNK